jgi:hypothetical protein
MRDIVPGSMQLRAKKTGPERVQVHLTFTTRRAPGLIVRFPVIRSGPDPIYYRVATEADHCWPPVKEVRAGARSVFGSNKAVIKVQ